MGRRGRGGARKSWKRDSGRGPPHRGRAHRDEVERENQQLQNYYNKLGIFESEAEQEQFWATLRRELPHSFRFTGSKGQALPVQQLLKDRYIPQITSIKHEDQQVLPPSPIPWFPDQLAWQMTTPKHIVRRFPPFASFQKFLVSETSVGNISRQEAVSMIPPLLIDLHPGMTVLDMCAAPGSKAAQLLEMVHAGEEARIRQIEHTQRQQEGRAVSPEGDAMQQEMQEQKSTVAKGGDWTDDGRATGLLIANDSDYKRAHMLTHQLKRLNSPNLIITNHDATAYPPIKLPPGGSNGVTTASGGAQTEYLRFDRILADVPCSGDGTLRKNINMWKDWVPGNALGLFPTQMRILIRALQLLKVGGRVVYSTCSMNPIENEAVVATAIDRCGGRDKVDIVDCSSALPLLKRRPGLRQWKVIDKRGHTWESWKRVQAELTKEPENPADHEALKRLSEGMFGSPDEDFPFERCMRVYPHLQDTGGFFITVLEKKAEVKVKPEGGQTKPTVASATQPAAPIVAAVNELEQKPIKQEASSVDAVTKIEALDAILPPNTDSTVDTASAAARQNMEVAPVADANAEVAVNSSKRPLHEIADAEMASKRPKVRDEVDEPAPEGAEDRRVHWPPPPGAILDASRPNGNALPTNFAAEVTPAMEREPADQQLSALKSTHRNGGKVLAYEEPYKYLSPTLDDLGSIYDFYDVSAKFPRTRFMVRNAAGVPARTIYYTSELARDILTINERSGLKFIHSGIKMFVKQEALAADACKWRIQNEGLPLLEPWLGERRSVRLYRRQTLYTLLTEMFPSLNAQGPLRTTELATPLGPMGTGCCVLRIEKKSAAPANVAIDDEGLEYRMVLPLWRSKYSVNLMLPKEDRIAMLLRLYNEDAPTFLHIKTNDRTASESKDSGSKDGQDAPSHAVRRNSSSSEESGDVDELMANGQASNKQEISEDDKEEGGVSVMTQ